jgi:predicted ArsR family transcriptional regulator
VVRAETRPDVPAARVVKSRGELHPLSTEDRIREMLAERSMSADEIGAALKIGVVGVRGALERLVAAGAVSRAGSGFSDVWELARAA